MYADLIEVDRIIRWYRDDLNHLDERLTPLLPQVSPNAKRFILEFILNDIENRQFFVDCKTILQELLQSKDSPPLEYILVGEEGPAHDKHFTVRINRFRQYS